MYIDGRFSLLRGCKISGMLKCASIGVGGNAFNVRTFIVAGRSPALSKLVVGYEYETTTPYVAWHRSIVDVSGYRGAEPVHEAAMHSMRK